MSAKIISQDRLKEVLHYNPETGVFTWLISGSGKLPSRVAGTLQKAGYINIVIDNVNNYAHRLAWYYVYNKWPKEIDHINHNRADNRICNLRHVSSQGNSRNMSLAINNTSGIQGVSWDKDRNKWSVKVNINRRTINIGRYITKYAAAYARHAANIEHGFHPNHGR